MFALRGALSRARVAPLGRADSARHARRTLVIRRAAAAASDDAVLAAAMSAVLSTPRGDAGGPSVVPDAVLGHGMSKMFKRQVL